MEKNPCEECTQHPAILFCQDCEQLFCDLCNLTIHRNGTRKSHIRNELPASIPPIPIPQVQPTKNFWKTIQVSKIDNQIKTNSSKLNFSGKDSYAGIRRKAAFSENFLDKGLVSLMKKWAYEGNIMHEFKDLTEKLALALQVSKEMSSEMIWNGCRVGKLWQQVKKVGAFDVSVVSLKVEKMSVKVLLWVLRSLKVDEMISTEKAIQSRLKEAFDVKLSPMVWSVFLENALKIRTNHKKSFSESQTFSLFSEQSNVLLKNLNFQIKSIRDLGTGIENIVIYPSNEEWISYDQYIKSGDVFHIKQSQEWRAFIEFFDSLFSLPTFEEKAISGGRYGCAQYLKKSSESLQNSSLGKLSYMVQLAIDEDLLRYHKTLLVWVPAFDKKCKEDKQALIQTKKLVVDILATCPEGISLAQLPTLIKENHPQEIDLSRLGFAKLKDLICEIPDIELSSKGKNHPFVRVVKKSSVSTEAVLAFLLEKIEEVGRVAMIDCEIEVADRFGYSFRWGMVKAKGLKEFLKASGEFVVVDKVFVEKKREYHSYTSSTTSEAYSYYASQEPCFEDAKNRLEDLEDQQKKFIEGLLED